MTRNEINAYLAANMTPADLEEVEYKKECVRETMDEETATWGSTDMTEIDTLEAFIRMVELAEHTASPRHRDPGDRRDAAADLKRYNVLLAAVGFYEPRTDEYCREAVRNGINVRMRDFPRINGIRHECVTSWEGFLESTK
jgi:hypothetical protein